MTGRTATFTLRRMASLVFAATRISVGVRIEGNEASILVQAGLAHVSA